MLYAEETLPREKVCANAVTILYSTSWKGITTTLDLFTQLLSGFAPVSLTKKSLFPTITIKSKVGLTA